jgi:hypothetical protein
MSILGPAALAGIAHDFPNDVQALEDAGANSPLLAEKSGDTIPD